MTSINILGSFFQLICMCMYKCTYNFINKAQVYNLNIRITSQVFFFFFFNLPLLCLAAQLCPTLCGPTDYSSPGFSVHGVFQARILEWVAITFSRGSS